MGIAPIHKETDVFQALYELCKSAALTMTISADEKAGLMTVNVIPKPKNDPGEAALAQPLSLTATPAEFDAEFVTALCGYAAKRASLLAQAEATNEVLDAAKDASAKQAAAAAKKASKPARKPEASGEAPHDDDAAASGGNDAKQGEGTSHDASTELNLFA